MSFQRKLKIFKNMRNVIGMFLIFLLFYYKFYIYIYIIMNIYNESCRINLVFLGFLTYAFRERYISLYTCIHIYVYLHTCINLCHLILFIYL